MKKKIRTICYDEELKIEAYRLEGIIQPFPNHFHDHYVIGFVENGKRSLSCRNNEYILDRGNIVLFNPGDNHSCAQADEGTLDYRAFNIPAEVMSALSAETAGTDELPVFGKTVIYDEELVNYLRPLHQMVMSGSGEFEKEEYLLMMISLLIDRYGNKSRYVITECISEKESETRAIIEKICDYIERNYAQHIYLEQLCKCSNLSKSTLLRAFTKSKGVTPYRYLQTVRINNAKKLMESGTAPIDAALQTGFSDQSHFTNFFTTFIGLSPGAYRDIFLENKKNSGSGELHGEK